MKRIPHFILGYLLPVAAVAVALPTLVAGHVHNPQAFACNSQTFELLSFKFQLAVISPNGKLQIRLGKKGDFRVLAGRRQIANLPSYRDISCCIEVGWSPDSTQFFIMYSDGGGIGNYHVHIFRIAGNRVVESPTPRVVAATFRSHHYCIPRGNNLFLLDWTANSRDVFFVGEVYPTSDCGSQMGFYTGFLANANSGKILRRFGEKETSAIEKSCRASGKLVLPRLH